MVARKDKFRYFFTQRKLARKKSRFTDFR